MNRPTIYSFYFLFALVNALDVHAEEEKELPVNRVNCSKEELLSFFPQPVIEFVLVQAHFSQEEAARIAQELSQKDGELRKLVEKKAAEVSPNPFQNSSQREIASKIYQETVYEVFAGILKTHGITDDRQIRSLLEEMRIIQSKLFVDCIRNFEVASVD